MGRSLRGFFCSRSPTEADNGNNGRIDYYNLFRGFTEKCPSIGRIGLPERYRDLEALLSVKPQVLFITYMDGPLADEIQRTSEIPTVVLNYGAFATFDEAVYDES